MMTLEAILSLVEQKVTDIRCPKQPAHLYDPIAYLLAMKGKKIRPAFTLIACNLYKEDVREAVNMALAWEIFHNFTLMHDDVMDKADVRRGEPTVHKKWDENTAILSGDAMLILAYKYLAKSPSAHLKDLLDLFSTTAAEICEGQEYDMQFETHLNVREEEYLNMIRLKTAVLLGATLKSGALLGEAEDQDRNLLYDFGINIGIAFQIQDDLLDVYGDPTVFGKKIGGDILCNKKTYLLVSALNTNNEQDRAELLHWLEIDDRPEEKIAAVTALYSKLLLKEKAQSLMDCYFKNAIRLLNNLNVPNENKAVLMNLVKELMNRKS
jgi:geranylgeranyl diphosphate synthase type II